MLLRLAVIIVAGAVASPNPMSAIPAPPRIDRAALGRVAAARLRRAERVFAHGGPLYWLVDDQGKLRCNAWRVTPTGQRGSYEFDLVRKYRRGAELVELTYSGGYDDQDVRVYFRSHGETRHLAGGMGSGRFGNCRSSLDVDPRGKQLSVEGGTCYLDLWYCLGASERERARRAQTPPPTPVTPGPLSPDPGC
jgi:hypothetical protein